MGTKARAAVAAGGEVVPAGMDLPAMTPARGGLRERHDGWTARWQEQMVEALARTGCVRDTCRRMRISGTSFYRARARLPEFDRRCREALAAARPSLEEVAYQRAVAAVVQSVPPPMSMVARRTGKRLRPGWIAALPPMCISAILAAANV